MEELKESEKTLLELAHLTIEKHSTIKDHENIWKAFRLGMKYQVELGNESK